MKFKLLKIAIAAFTMTEILIATTISSVAVLGLYSFFSMGQNIATKTLSISATATASRNTVEKIKLAIEASYKPPLLTGVTVNEIIPPFRTGTTFVSGSAQEVRIPNHGNGIYFDRFIGGPYVLEIGADGIEPNPTQLKLTSDDRTDTAKQGIQVYDAVYLNATTLASSTTAAIRLAVTGVSDTPAIDGFRKTYTVQIADGSALKDKILPANSRGERLIVTANVVRPVWIVASPIDAGAGDGSILAAELRYYEPYVDADQTDYTTFYLNLSPQTDIYDSSDDPGYGEPKPFTLPDDTSVSMDMKFISSKALDSERSGRNDGLNYDANGKFVVAAVIALRSKSAK